LHSAKPAVLILATGGTIAGQAADEVKSSSYASGVLDVGSLLAAVPGLAAVAEVRGEQVAGIGSEDMTEEVWFKLATRLNRAARDPGVDGTVVLHGTDTMEETAYFLNLVVKTEKPLALTGAMRPANAVGADGPRNIFNAVSLAASRAARGMGALIVFNDRVFAAREATKLDAMNVDAFGSPGLGPLGCMVDGKAHLYRKSLRRHTSNSEFDVSGLETLPRVEIIYGHAGQRPELVEAAVRLGARGIVHAGVGAANIHVAVKPAIIEARRKGVAVVAASRTGGGTVPARRDELGELGVVYPDNLNPQKSRVLLQLALARTSDPEAIQECFATY
jgi:L-asparaginase type II